MNIERDQDVSIRISTSISTSIELVTMQNFDFQGVERVDNVISIDPINNPRAAKMIARGTPGAEIQISYIPTRELTSFDGSSVLFFEYFLAGNNEDEQESSELLEAEFRGLQFNNEGEFFIWVGGRTDLSNARPGRYDGEFTIEIEYI